MPPPTRHSQAGTGATMAPPTPHSQAGVEATGTMEACQVHVAEATHPLPRQATHPPPCPCRAKATCTMEAGQVHRAMAPLTGALLTTTKIVLTAGEEYMLLQAFGLAIMISVAAASLYGAWVKAGHLLTLADNVDADSARPAAISAATRPCSTAAPPSAALHGWLCRAATAC